MKSRFSRSDFIYNLKKFIDESAGSGTRCHPTTENNRGNFIINGNSYIFEINEFESISTSELGFVITNPAIKKYNSVEGENLQESGPWFSSDFSTVRVAMSRWESLKVKKKEPLNKRAKS